MDVVLVDRSGWDQSFLDISDLPTSRDKTTSGRFCDFVSNRRDIRRALDAGTCCVTSQHGVCRSSSSPTNLLDSPSSATGSGSRNDVVGGRSRGAMTSYSVVANFLPSWDAERLESVYRRLRLCGFYYGRVSVDEAAARLSRWPVGSYLLRDSSDSRYLFSLSVQTCRGTTSIRITYQSGLFRFDCQPDQQHLMPTFDCVLRLLQHYNTRRHPTSTGGLTSASGCASAAANGYVLLEATGRKDTPVLLRTAYRDRVSSLSHLCRLKVNQSLNQRDGSSPVDRLHLLPSLKVYVKDYPYTI